MDIRQKSAQIGQQLRRLQLRMGLAGWLALLLLGLALLELFTQTLPTAQSGSALQEQLQAQQQTQEQRREIRADTDTSPAQQLAAFENFFPPVADINQLLGAIYAAADKEQLLLERGEYRLSEEPGLALLRYQITLPVKGQQAEIKRFVRRLLRDMPALSLDGISMQRPNVGEAQIDAQIRLSVIMQGER